MLKVEEQCQVLLMQNMHLPSVLNLWNFNSMRARHLSMLPALIIRINQTSRTCASIRLRTVLTTWSATFSVDPQPSNDVVCDCADTDIGVRRELELDITILGYVSIMFRVITQCFDNV